MKKFAILLVFVCPLAVGQNAPIPTLPFSFTATAVTLPGAKASFVGTDAGVSFQPNEYVSFSEHNILSTDSRLQFFGGGIDYFFPAISLKINNMDPNLSGFRMLVSIGVTFGDARVNLGSTTVAHWGEDFHASFSYALTSSSAWQMGIRAGAARYPYFSSGWVPVIEGGPKFSF
jgi:hypothetical protein